MKQSSPKRHPNANTQKSRPSPASTGRWVGSASPCQAFPFQVQSPLLLEVIALLALGLLLPILVGLGAAAVVEVADGVAVEFGLLQPLVDLVVHEARPPSRSVAAARLGRVLVQQLAEVRGALAAGVEPSQELNVRQQGKAVVLGRFFGESSHHRVEEFPGRPPEFGPEKERVSLHISNGTKERRGWEAMRQGGEKLLLNTYLAVSLPSLGAIEPPFRMLSVIAPRSALLPEPFDGENSSEYPSVDFPDHKYVAPRKVRTAITTIRVICCRLAIMMLVENECTETKLQSQVSNGSPHGWR